MTSEYPLGSEKNPLRVAIVGSGPSGFYAAEALFRQKDLAVEVDMFDRLPTPYGLVRYGVAPDHQKIKAVIPVYEKTARRPGFRFFGNVSLGGDLQVEDLRRFYDQIVYAVGAETDRRLNIHGEDLIGSESATAFVAWFNGHPDYLDCEFDLTHKRVVVVGIGNVAIDVARILLRDPDELALTDISEPALSALRRSRVKEVLMLGRRGAAEAAFSPKEIEEIGNLSGVDLVVRPEDVDLSNSERAGLEKGSNALKNVEYLSSRSKAGEGTHEKKMRLLLLTSPVRLLGDESERVRSVEIERNELVRDENGVTRAHGTGQTEIVEAGLVFRSVGYHGVPLPGVPFHERWGVICNEGGRVTEPNGTPRPGEYVVGWAKRGPTGLIGTNRGCANDTVALMVEDVGLGPAWAPVVRTPDAVEEFLSAKGVRFVTFDDWKLLDEGELARGEEMGKIRDKYLSRDDMLSAIVEARARETADPSAPALEASEPPRPPSQPLTQRPRP